MEKKPSITSRDIQQIVIKSVSAEFKQHHLSRRQKAKQNLRKAGELYRQLSLNIKATKKPENLKLLQASLEKVKAFRHRQLAILGVGKIVRASDISKVAVFAETPWRELTTQEKRVDFAALEETFIQSAVGIRKELSAVVSEDLTYNLGRLRKRLEDGDINSLVDLTLVSRNKVYAVIIKYMKAAYEMGKKTASDEINVERPSTPLLDTQLMNLHADVLAEKFVTAVDVAAKETAMEGYAKGLKIGYQSPIKLASSGTIMIDVSSAVEEESADAIVGVSVTITATYINKGRQSVFDKHESKIKFYQRSEVLDNRTCPFCEGMDKRIFNSNDPLTEEDLFHENCRGIWVPVLNGEDYDEEYYGIPKGLANEAVNEYDLPKTTTPIAPPNGPGAEYKPASPEFRPPSEVKKAVPIKDIEYAVSADAEAAQEDVQNGQLSKTKGPILVTKKGEGYEIIDGAHRLEAARLAGEKTIDIRIVDADLARTYGTDEFNKLMRPALTGTELKAYNGLAPDAQTLYDKLRIDGDIPHAKAIKEAKNIDKWKDFAASKDPLGAFESAFPERKRQAIIVDEILKRYKK